MDAVTTGTHSRIEQIGPERARTPALVGAVWALLVINTIGSSGTGALIRLPTTVFQLITMGALGAAFLLALVLNPRIRLRRNVFLLVATVLAAEGIFTSVSPPTTLGSVFRCARLAVFVLTLWLLSCWWEDSLRFVLHHIRALGVLLGTVLVGLAVAPGHALPAAYGGRLVGALWYFPPPRVAEYAAVVSGLAVVLWLGRQVSGRSTLVVAGPAVAMVLLTHTRTATIGLVAALAAAILTLLLSNSRARRALTWSVLATTVAAIGFGAVVQTWLLRGQSEQQLADLTGRQKVWDGLLAAPRTLHDQLIGMGLSNKSFGGLPVDSSWLSVYQDQGLIGVAIIAAMFVVLLVTAAIRPPSPARAAAIFLIVFCAISSYTEDGLGDATTYFLHLTLAAALLAPGAAAAFSAPPSASREQRASTRDDRSHPG